MNPNNVSLADFRRFLIANGCKCIKDTKGHEKWSHPNATRPIVIQSHIDPVPIHVIKSNLRTLGLTLTDIRGFD